jgi:hypothetical protein
LRAKLIALRGKVTTTRSCVLGVGQRLISIADSFEAGLATGGTPGSLAVYRSCTILGSSGRIRRRPALSVQQLIVSRSLWAVIVDGRLPGYLGGFSRNGLDVLIACRFNDDPYRFTLRLFGGFVLAEIEDVLDEHVRLSDVVHDLVLGANHSVCAVPKKLCRLLELNR